VIGKARLPRSRGVLLAAAVGVVLAAVTGVGAWTIATAPKATVRLAVVPLEGAADVGLDRAVAAQLGQIKGNKQTGFKLLARGKTTGATHLLYGTLRPENGKLALHARLTDIKSGVDAKKWNTEYTPDQTKYMPVALAGMVTEAFHLLPPMTNAKVNAAARPEYDRGLAAFRWESKADEAVAAFDRAVAADPDSPLTHAWLAHAEWVKFYGTRDRAWLARTTEAERQAELCNPDLAAVHGIRGLLIYNSGRYDQALAEFQRSIELEPGVSDGYRRLARSYASNNEIDKALAAYQKALSVEPSYYRNFQDLGAFWFSRGDYSQATRYFAEAEKLAPGEPNLRFALGAAYKNLGRFTDAETEFRSMLALRPTEAAFRELGSSLMYQGKDSEAIQYLDRAVALGAENYICWMKLGIAYRRAGLIAKSKWANRQGLNAAREEVKRNARSGEAHSFLAYFYARLGENQPAELEIEQALQLSPDDGDVRWMVAVTYEALELPDKTIDVLQKAPYAVLADLSRWPDLAELNKNPRFLQLLESHETR